MEGEHTSLVDNSKCLESYNAQSCQEYLHLHNDNDNDSTSNDDESSSSRPTNKSSVSQTTFNMVKMCIGTGSLAIPFAASEGGLLFFAIGTFIVVLWNAYDVYLLLDARQYITSSSSEESKAKSKDNNDDDDDHGVVENQLPRSTVTVTVGEDTSLNSLSKVALHVFGKYGSNAIDFLMILLMVGIIVAYEDAILGFTSETLLTTGSKRIDALWMIVAITPFLLPNSYEGAAHLSILGSGLIAAAFIVIGLYGIKENNDNDGLSGFWFHHLLSLSMWPRNFASFSKWFGVVVFGLGVVPFSYSLQESMENPDQMMQATKRSLGIVYIAYAMIGCVISIIFSHGIETDIISSLPRGYIPDGLRIVMSLMVCSTVPLISIPAGELINEKVQFLIGNIDDGLGSGSGSGSGSGVDPSHSPDDDHNMNTFDSNAFNQHNHHNNAGAEGTFDDFGGGMDYQDFDMNMNMNMNMDIREHGYDDIGGHDQFDAFNSFAGGAGDFNSGGTGIGGTQSTNSMLNSNHGADGNNSDTANAANAMCAVSSTNNASNQDNSSAATMTTKTGIGGGSGSGSGGGIFSRFRKKNNENAKAAANIDTASNNAASNIAVSEQLATNSPASTDVTETIATTATAMTNESSPSPPPGSLSSPVNESSISNHESFPGEDDMTKVTEIGKEIEASDAADSDDTEMVVATHACGDSQFGDMTTTSAATTDSTSTSINANENAIECVDENVDVNMNVNINNNAVACEGEAGGLNTDAKASPTAPPIIENKNDDNAMNMEMEMEDSPCVGNECDAANTPNEKRSEICNVILRESSSATESTAPASFPVQTMGGTPATHLSLTSASSPAPINICDEESINVSIPKNSKEAVSAQEEPVHIFGGTVSVGNGETAHERENGGEGKDIASSIGASLSLSSSSLDTVTGKASMPSTSSPSLPLMSSISKKHPPTRDIFRNEKDSSATSTGAGAATLTHGHRIPLSNGHLQEESDMPSTTTASENSFKNRDQNLSIAVTLDRNKHERGYEHPTSNNFTGTVEQHAGSCHGATIIATESVNKDLSSPLVSNNCLEKEADILVQTGNAVSDATFRSGATIGGCVSTGAILETPAQKLRDSAPFMLQNHNNFSSVLGIDSNASSMTFKDSSMGIMQGSRVEGSGALKPSPPSMSGENDSHMSMLPESGITANPNPERVVQRPVRSSANTNVTSNVNTTNVSNKFRARPFSLTDATRETTGTTIASTANVHQQLPSASSRIGKSMKELRAPKKITNASLPSSIRMKSNTGANTVKAMALEQSIHTNNQKRTSQYSTIESNRANSSSNDSTVTVAVRQTDLSTTRVQQDAMAPSHNAVGNNDTTTGSNRTNSGRNDSTGTVTARQTNLSTTRVQQDAMAPNHNVGVSNNTTRRFVPPKVATSTTKRSQFISGGTMSEGKISNKSDTTDTHKSGQMKMSSGPNSNGNGINCTTTGNTRVGLSLPTLNNASHSFSTSNVPGRQGNVTNNAPTKQHQPRSLSTYPHGRVANGITSQAKYVDVVPHSTSIANAGIDTNQELAGGHRRVALTTLQPPLAANIAAESKIPPPTRAAAPMTTPTTNRTRPYATAAIGEGLTLNPVTPSPQLTARASSGMKRSSHLAPFHQNKIIGHRRKGNPKDKSFDDLLSQFTEDLLQSKDTWDICDRELLNLRQKVCLTSNMALKLQGEYDDLLDEIDDVLTAHG